MEVDCRRIDDGGSFDLSDVRTEPKDPAVDERAYAAALERHIDALSELQQRLYADGRWAVLLIFQGMDTSGKDGTIAHVTTGINPAGFQVYSFKRPSAEELRHDWMWRSNCRLPEKGRIGIFNRSYYEELVVVRVHPELLDAQGIPSQLRGDHFWKRRAEALVNAERMLVEGGTKIIKFFLHISKDEQARRLIKRGRDGTKLWKFSLGDLAERELWAEYQHAWSRAIAMTASEHAPWYVVPGDKKHLARIAVAEVLVRELSTLPLEWPKVDKRTRREIAAALKQLEGERG